MERADFTQTQDFIDFQEWQANRQRLTQTHLSPSSSAAPPIQRHETEESSGLFSQMSINDLLLTPGRENMTELHPLRRGNATWFSYDKQITKSVLQMIKSDLQIFSATYSELPENVKKRWFKSFAQEFNWNPTYSRVVRVKYDHVAASVYSNQVYAWKKRWKTGKGSPTWITDVEVWNGFVNHWKSVKAEKKANRNKGNRNSHRGGDGPAVHTTGSKSYARRFEELTKAAGEPPNMVAFMVDTHTSKKTNTIIDNRAKKIVENVMEKEQNILSQETQDGSVQSNSLSQTEINELFLQEIEGSNNYRFGFGSLPHFSKSSSSTMSDTSNLVMQEELQAANLKIVEMEKAQTEQAKAQQAQAKAQEKQAKELDYFKKMFFQQFPDLAPPTPPTDPQRNV